MVTGSLDLKIVKKKNELKFSGLVNALVSNQAPSVLQTRFPAIYKLFWNYTPEHCQVTSSDWHK